MTTETKTLTSRRFVALNVVILLCFGNLAAFFDFYSYLKGMQLPEASFGILIGVFNLTALLVRPVISLYIHRRNALKWMLAGIIVQAVALASYRFGLSFSMLMIIRVCHGLAYVTLLSACMTALVAIIPKGRSAHAFSVVSVTTLIPFVAVPPLVARLGTVLGGYTNVLAGFGLLALAAAPLLILLRSDNDSEVEESHAASLGWSDMKKNMRNYPVLVGLLATFIFYCIYAIILFYINGFASEKGLVSNGLFVTVTSVSMIVVRLLLGPYLDKLGRRRLTSIAMLIMIACSYALLKVQDTRIFLVIAFFTGISWGITVPLLSALVCDTSEEKYRAFNVNLSSEVTDGGFFVGPAIGGYLLTTQHGYASLFVLCAVLAFAVLACLPFMKDKRKS